MVTCADWDRMYRKMTSFNESIKTWYVYWIVAESDRATPLYVGVTTKSSRRAREHKCRLSRKLNVIKKADRYLLVPVKKVIGNFAAARACEAREIASLLSSGFSLANAICQKQEPKGVLSFVEEQVNTLFVATPGGAN